MDAIPRYAQAADRRDGGRDGRPRAAAALRRLAGHRGHGVPAAARARPDDAGDADPDAAAARALHPARGVTRRRRIAVVIACVVVAIAVAVAAFGGANRDRRPAKAATS